MTNFSTLQFMEKVDDWWQSLDDTDKQDIIVGAYCKEKNVMLE